MNRFEAVLFAYFDLPLSTVQAASTWLSLVDHNDTLRTERGRTEERQQYKLRREWERMLALYRNIKDNPTMGD